MAELDPHAPASSQDSGTAGPHRNGKSDGEPHAQPAPNADGDAKPNDHHEERSNFERAEEMVDNLAEKAASVTASGGRKLLWFVSRAREVAEDFWADVQDFRQGKKP
jgi:hypothetical protein